MKGTAIRRLAGHRAGIWPLAAAAALAAAFAAPWYGSLAGRIPAGQSVTGIAGE